MDPPNHVRLLTRRGAVAAAGGATIAVSLALLHAGCSTDVAGPANGADGVADASDAASANPLKKGQILMTTGPGGSLRWDTFVSFTDATPIADAKAFCVSSQVGPCLVTTCGNAPHPTQTTPISVVTITSTDRSAGPPTEANINFAPSEPRARTDTAYASSGIFRADPGTAVHVNAQAGAIPAFSVDLMMPMLIRLTAPVGCVDGGNGRCLAARTEPLPISWSGGPSETVQVHLRASDDGCIRNTFDTSDDYTCPLQVPTAICTFDAASHSASIPVEALQQYGWANATVTIVATNTRRFVDGDYAVEVTAATNGTDRYLVVFAP